MDINDQRDYAEEAANAALLREEQDEGDTETVTVKWDESIGTYIDVDNPDDDWQLMEFGDDSYDCIVCDFPIDPGEHFGNGDDRYQNAHKWCVTVLQG